MCIRDRLEEVLAVGLLAIIDGTYPTLKEAYLVGFTPVEAATLKDLMAGYAAAEAGSGGGGGISVGGGVGGGGGGVDWLLARVSSSVQKAHTDTLSQGSPCSTSSSSPRSPASSTSFLWRAPKAPPSDRPYGKEENGTWDGIWAQWALSLIHI